jgi:RHS repeat-associated protein
VNGARYQTAVLGYDPLGRAAGNTVTIPATALDTGIDGTYTTYQDYKIDGHLAHTSYAELPSVLPAESVAYTYDDLGQVKTSSGGYDGETFDYVTDTTYTRYGELARTQLGDPGKRVWLSRYYDTHTRRLQRTIMDAEVPTPMQADVNYGYDPFGNITSVTDKAPGNEETQCFRYDYLQRLTEAWTPDADCAADPDVAALDGPAQYWESFTYDVSGNRLTRTQHAAAGDTVQTSTYPAPGQNHAHAVSSVRTTGPGVDVTGQITHDAAGNVTAKPGQILAWDAEGRLAKVTEGDKVTEFVQDADGNRLIRRDPTGTTLYLGGQELRVNKADGRRSATRYYQHGSQTVAMRDASGLTWLAGDHQGTAQLAVNSTGLDVVRRRQTPFGGVRGTGKEFPGEKGFVGGTDDSSTGLVHLGAREYDPALGRFLSVDAQMSLSDPQTMNGYTYAANSPVTKMDPSGRSWLSDVGNFFSGVGDWLYNNAGTIGAAFGIAALFLSGPWGWAYFAIAAVATTVDMYQAQQRGDGLTLALDTVSMVGGGIAKMSAVEAKSLREGSSLLSEDQRHAAEWADVAQGTDAIATGFGTISTGTGGLLPTAEERAAADAHRDRRIWEQQEAALEAAPATDNGCYAAGNRSQTVNCDSPEAVRPLGASYCSSGRAVPSDCMFTRKERIDQKKMPGRQNLGTGRGQSGPGFVNASYGSPQAQKNGYYETADHKFRQNDGHGYLMF